MRACVVSVLPLCVKIDAMLIPVVISVLPLCVKIDAMLIPVVISVLQLCVKIDAMLIPVVIIIIIYYERARLTGRFVVVVAFGFRLM